MEPTSSRMTCKGRVLGPERVVPKTSQAMNHGPWEGQPNEKRFMDALGNFMQQSWTVICQVRERAGLNVAYEMSQSEIAQRIAEVQKKLDEKYKEVEALESQKAKLITKKPSRRHTSGRSNRSSSKSNKTSDCAKSCPENY